MGEANMDVPSTVSVIIGAVSVVVAVFAIAQGAITSRDSRRNFEKTRDVLAEIDKRAAITEKIVAENQRELLDTVKKLAIPEKPDIGEEIGAEFMRALLQDPNNATELMSEIMKMAPIQEEQPTS
ncbi:MAG: hypothetical protein F4Y54_03015 [Dehalococcoidia bacterium]|nr:hypothetical protein [Dehalococcoidia bacterium]